MTADISVGFAAILVLAAAKPGQNSPQASAFLNDDRERRGVEIFARAALAARLPRYHR
jgi:hypothetical protein